MSTEQRKTYRLTGLYAFVVGFLLAVSLPYPVLAVVLALVVAVAMVGGAAALNLRDANRRVELAVAEEVSR